MSPFLKIEHLNKAFGGLKAVNDVSLDLMPGKINAIIGPNGAGKTTLFNLISGFIPSDSGRIVFEGTDITSLKPFEISRLGIKRTLQIKSIFPSMTAYENIWMSANAHLQNLHPFRRWTSYANVKRKVEEVIEYFELQKISEIAAGTLSYGDVALLEIGMAVAADPKVILLDEPVCGMSPAETERVVAKILALSKRFQIVIIEHDMEVVFRMADHITVMAFGSVLAAGSPAEIAENQKVKDVYFGAEEEVS
jgi:branched-chain amino acid transport system ATP-binding protein